jgi:uncharacterized protein (UPF0332 family)
MANPDPTHLFEQAQRLLAILPTEREPRPTDLRRALSTAYYAVFHFVVAEGADLFFGARSTEEYVMAYRSVTHDWLRSLCDQLQGLVKAKKPPHAPGADFFGDVEKFATTVAELQELRHSADYDPEFSTTVDEVIIRIHQARQALNLFRGASDTQRVAFLALLFFNIRQV